MKYSMWLIASVLAGLVGLAGCGGGDKNVRVSAGGVSGGTGSGTGTVGSGTGSGTGGTGSTDAAFTFDTGIGGSGGLIGQIDGFGSIILNGLEMNTDDAQFFIEGQSGAESELHEGYFVVVTGDLGSLDAEEVYYRSNIKGPVSAPPDVLDAGTGRYQFSVLGQTVITSASTRFDGTLAENIVEGDELEVSGAMDSTGIVLATYLEIQAGLTEFKAIGIVSNLDDVTERFMLGGLQVDYSTAALTEFEGASLVDGLLVEVRLDTGDFSAPDSALVTAVELLPTPEIEEGAEVEVEGIIDRFVSASDFSVSGVAIASNAATSYENGDATGLGLNVRVQVEGVADAASVILAEQIEFKADDAIRVEANVTAVTTADGVTGTVATALGITFTVRASTEVEDDTGLVANFTLNDLMVGDFVELRGFLEGNLVVAVELEREDPNTEALLRGPLSAFDKLAATVEIQNVVVTEQDGTTSYEDENDNSVDRDTFFNALQIGMSVEAKWDDFSSLSAPADDLSLEDDD